MKDTHANGKGDCTDSGKHYTDPKGNLERYASTPARLIVVKAVNACAGARSHCSEYPEREKCDPPHDAV